MLKKDMKFSDRLENGGKYTECDNPDCPNAYHYMKDVSYSILNQDRPDGSIIDLSLCSLDCLIKMNKVKEDFAIQ